MKLVKSIMFVFSFGWVIFLQLFGLGMTLIDISVLYGICVLITCCFIRGVENE